MILNCPIIGTEKSTVSDNWYSCPIIGSLHTLRVWTSFLVQLCHKLENRFTKKLKNGLSIRENRKSVGYSLAKIRSFGEMYPIIGDLR